MNMTEKWSPLNRKIQAAAQRGSSPQRTGEMKTSVPAAGGEKGDNQSHPLEATNIYTKFLSDLSNSRYISILTKMVDRPSREPCYWRGKNTITRLEMPLIKLPTELLLGLGFCRVANLRCLVFPIILVMMETAEGGLNRNNWEQI